jgi:hypothetical protein
MRPSVPRRQWTRVVWHWAGLVAVLALSLGWLGPAWLAVSTLMDGARHNARVEAGMVWTRICFAWYALAAAAWIAIGVRALVHRLRRHRAEHRPI